MKIIEVVKEKKIGTYTIIFDKGGKLILYDEIDGRPIWLYIEEEYGNSIPKILQAAESLKVWAKVLNKLDYDEIDMGDETKESISSGIPISEEIRDQILNKTLWL